MTKRTHGFWYRHVPKDVIVPSARNLLVNADFEVDQMHEGASVPYANALNYVTDQWFLTGNPGAATGIAAQRVATAPPGHSFSERIDFGTGGAVGAANLLLFCQRLSGDQSGGLGYGSAEPSPISLSFTLRASVAGILPWHMRHNYPGGSSTWLEEFNYKDVGEYQDFSATIPGDTLHPTSLDAANDVTIGFGLASGANDMDLPGRWNTNTHHTTAGMWQLATISGAWVEFSAVNLVAFSEPTPWARRDSLTELLLNQRYLEKSYDPGVVPGTAAKRGGSIQVVAGDVAGLIHFRSKVTADKVGTWAIYSPVTGAAGMVADIDGAADVAATLSDAGVNGASFTFAATVGHRYAGHYVRNGQL